MIMGRSSLLMVDGHLVCLGESGQLLLLKVNPEKFEEVSRLVLRRDGKPLLYPPCWAAPVLSHGLLYLRGADKPGGHNGRLVCLELIP
jgi:hypothetical protein